MTPFLKLKSQHNQEFDINVGYIATNNRNLQPGNVRGAAMRLCRILANGGRSCQGVIIQCRAFKGFGNVPLLRFYYSRGEKERGKKNKQADKRWKCNDTFGYQQ